MPAHPNFDPSRHLDAEFSYGLDALDGEPSLSLTLAGAGRENAAAAEPGHTVELRASLRH